MSKCIKPYLNISCFDAIVGFCCRFDFSRFFGWCWNSKQICSREFLTSTISTFMRPPRAGMHTKRSASTSLYGRTETIFFVFQHRLSHRQNRLKTYSCGTVWKPDMCSYILIKCMILIECMLGELRLGRLGNRWAGVLAVICLVFKTLSKNPCR